MAQQLSSVRRSRLESVCRRIERVGGNARLRACKPSPISWKRPCRLQSAKKPVRCSCASLNGVLFELAQLSREKAKLESALPARWQDAGLYDASCSGALGFANFYPAPFAFTLKEFTQVQASIFQLAQSARQMGGLHRLLVPDSWASLPCLYVRESAHLGLDHARRRCLESADGAVEQP